MQLTYDHIGIGYNTTRKADPYLAERIYALLKPQPAAHYLDIGSGTGNYTFALAEKGIMLTGVEPSDTMRSVAMQKYPGIRWLKGSSEAIPSPDHTFHGILATLTIHHWPNLTRSFLELDRVLVPHGKMVIFTSTPDQMKGYWLNHYFPLMMKVSMETMPSLQDLEDAMVGTRLTISQIETYEIQDDLQDCFLYIGKNKPGIYFDDRIRNGISSFAVLSTPSEVSQGLTRLRADLESNAFDRCTSLFKNTGGDYLFICIEKSA